MTPKWLAGLWHWVYHLHHQCRPTSEGATVFSIPRSLCQRVWRSAITTYWQGKWYQMYQEISPSLHLHPQMSATSSSSMIVSVNSWRAFLSDASEVAIDSANVRMALDTSPQLFHILHRVRVNAFGPLIAFTFEYESPFTKKWYDHFPLILHWLISSK